MSAWADLAGDDSNLSMAADEFVGLSVLGDISNSVSHNRSRFDPELDNSKQGLNRQLKLFGLGNDSNSNLSKKRRHSDLQTEEDDVDMPPKSKQRTSGPGQNNFSRFLEPGATSAPDLSSLSSSSTNASGTTGSLGSVSTPTSAENHKPRTWYSAILGKNKGRSSKKGTPRSVSSSRVPALISTTNTTGNPTPKSTSKTVKLGGSIPSSVRRRRMLRKRKSKSSPHKNVESTTSRQQEAVADVVVPETISPENDRQQYQPMDQDGGGDTREAFENGLKVLKTQSQGRIYVPLDILESTEKQAEQPKPTPFRMMRSKSAGKCGSMSPTKLSFTEENSPPATSGVSDSCASSPPVVPFNLFNFMPLPIPASSFGLTSTSVSNCETPNNEANGQDQIASVVQPQAVPVALPFVPFIPPVLPMNGLGFPSANSDESKTTQESNVPINPMLFNFVTMPLPLSAQISNGSSITALPSPPAFVPFVVAPPTIVQPIASTTETETEPQTVTETETNAMDTDEIEVVDVEDGKEEAEPVSIPSSSVWAAAPLEEDDDQVPSWAKKCFKQEVARNKVLKRREDQCKVEQKKIEMQYKIREKQLLPIQHASISGPYGSDNRDSTRRREYHPYAENAKNNNFRMDRRMRGRARTRSLSEGVQSPLYRTKVYKRKDSTSQSGTSAASPSQGGSLSVSVEARDLPRQDPEPVTAEKIARRIHQIEMAKNTTGYKNYMAQIPKCQRKKKHPSTPNPKENISKRRWIGKYKLWRQQLHEFDIEESMDVDERPEGQPEEQPEAIVDCSIPTPAGVELVASAPQEEEQ